MAKRSRSAGTSSPSFPHLLVDLHRHGATGSLKVTGPRTRRRCTSGRANPVRLLERLARPARRDPDRQRPHHARAARRGEREGRSGQPAREGAVGERVREPARAERGRARQGRAHPRRRALVGLGHLRVRGRRAAEGRRRPQALDRAAAARRGAAHPDRASRCATSSSATVLEPVPAGDSGLSEIRADVWPLLERLDGRRTLKDAIALTRLDEFEAAKTACALLFLGVVRRRAGSARSSTSPTRRRARSARSRSRCTRCRWKRSGRRACPRPSPRASRSRRPSRPPAGRAALRHREAEPDEARPRPSCSRSSPWSRSPSRSRSPPSRPRSPRPRASRGRSVAAQAHRHGPRRPARLRAPAGAGAGRRARGHAPVEPSIPEIPPAPAPASRPTEEDLAALDALLNPSAPDGSARARRRPRREKWEPQFRPPTTPPRKAAGSPRGRVAVAPADPRRRRARRRRPHDGRRLVLLPARPPLPGPARCRRPQATLAPPTTTLAAAPLPTAPPVVAPTPAATTAARVPQRRPRRHRRDAARRRPLPSHRDPAPAPTPRPAPAAPAGERTRSSRRARSPRPPAPSRPRSRRARGPLHGPGPHGLRAGERPEGGERRPAQELFVLPVELKGRACYRVCWGVYDSRPAAEAALRGLPSYFRQGGLSPRLSPLAELLP